MKENNRRDKYKIDTQRMSLRKILISLALFLQIQHLLNQSNTNKKFSPSQSLTQKNNSLLFSALLTTSEETILPLFLYALMPEKILSASITASVMFSLINLPITQAGLLDFLYEPEVTIDTGNIDALIDKFFEKANRMLSEGIPQVVKLTIQETGKVTEGIIEKVDEKSNKLIAKFKDVGDLLIEKVGGELRFSANEVLQQASHYGQIMISAAGCTLNLAIRETGVEFRSVISHARAEILMIASKLPKYSRLIGEGLAAGILNEAKEQLFGSSAIQKVIRKIDDYLREESPNLLELLSFVKNQPGLSPHEQSKLYVKLIEYVNDPKLSNEIREKHCLLIGAAAIDNERLLQYIDFGITNYQYDYREIVIGSIPYDSIRAILEMKDEQQFYNKLGLPMPERKVSDVGLLFFSLTSVVPPDYVKCDGSEYSVKEMPELYESIGRTYGHSYDTATKQDYFRVPDLRDYFLRMASPHRKAGTFEKDATRMPSNPFEIKSNGAHKHTIQQAGLHNHYALENGEHKHGFYGANGGWSHGEDYFGDRAGFLKNLETTAKGQHTHGISENGKHMHEIELAEAHTHILSGGDEETRPKNVAVTCLIKYRSIDLPPQYIQLKNEVRDLRNSMQKYMFFSAALVTTGVIIAATTKYFKK